MAARARPGPPQRPSSESIASLPLDMQEHLFQLETYLQGSEERLQNLTLNNLGGAAAITPEQYGAVGDDSTDDTTAFLNAMAAVGAGGSLVLTPGKTYQIDELVLLHTANNASIVCVGNATLKKRSSANTDFLVAHKTWVDDDTFIGNPFNFQGVTFDANSLADYALIHRSWNSNIERCSFKNADVDGLLITSQDSSGATITNTQVNNRVLNCKSFDNTACGVRFEGSKTTDQTVRDCYIYDNGTYGIHVDGVAGGFEITNNHTYNNTTADMLVDDSMSQSTTISNNFFEERVIIKSVGGALGTLGPGNSYRDGVTFQGDGTGSTETLIIKGETFEFGADILADLNGATKKIVAMNNTCHVTTFLTWTDSPSNTFITSQDNWNASINTFMTNQNIQGP